MTEILKPTPEGQTAAQQALEAIKQRSFSGRHPDLGKMINCQFCRLRHREHDNGRDKQCEQIFSADIRIRGIAVVVPERIAGQTKHTTPDFMIESEIPRKQQRIMFGANRVKGRRKNPRNRPQSSPNHWQRILIAKANKNVQETNQ